MAPEYDSHHHHKAGMEIYTCYELELACGRVVFVPHFVELGVFMGPGGLRTRAERLLALGARELKQPLLTRA